jgi:hypothetical protein
MSPQGRRRRQRAEPLICWLVAFVSFVIFVLFVQAPKAPSYRRVVVSSFRREAQP